MLPFVICPVLSHFSSKKCHANLYFGTKLFLRVILFFQNGTNFRLNLFDRAHFI